MSTRLMLTLLIYLLVQGVLFGIATVAVLATPLKEHAMALWPALIAVTFVLAAPLAWKIAPRMMLRQRRRRMAQP